MKIIRVAKDITEADKVIALAKTFKGFKTANRYRVSGKVHCIISGDFTDHEYSTIMENHRNLAR